MTDNLIKKIFVDKTISLTALHKYDINYNVILRKYFEI